MGSRLSFDVVRELTSFQDAVAGDVVPSKPTLNVCSPATYMTFPVFQFRPKEGSPAPLPPRLEGTA
ncbi:MAG TPA: hypothetical protein DEV93_08890 [Chloroflexi bacterium]|nr:hypothetical protein [Chloroflexota bacterium]